ncbi:MAG: Rrf2 family transcriptional regulator [Dehalococcoidia bacterium]|nr:Rrf2 family transcriptional regulator [Dehalococcoidia bacterium]
MRLSVRGDYGIRAVLDLAEHYGDGLVQNSGIAARQSIPEPYLQQLLLALRKSGLVRSVRGPRGGHALARSPEDLTLAEVMEALEGPISQDCSDDVSGCVQRDGCALRLVWRGVDQATKRILSSTTIAQLSKKRVDASTGSMYHI